MREDYLHGLFRFIVSEPDKRRVGAQPRDQGIKIGVVHWSCSFELKNPRGDQSRSSRGEIVCRPNVTRTTYRIVNGVSVLGSNRGGRRGTNARIVQTLNKI